MSRSKNDLFRSFRRAFRLALILSIVLSFVPAPALEFAGLRLGADDAEATPIVTAVKRDVLLVDNDVPGQANPGDTIRYTVILTQSGTTDATNVAFADMIDANTTLVPGSVKTTPVARHDSYSALGNVSISVPAGSGLLANDGDPDGGSVSVTAFDAASTNGGTVSVAGDGSFTYNPPPGYEGPDSFNYTITDDEGQTDPATVVLTVNGLIWFVDASASCPCDGRLSNPFPDLAVTANSFDLNAADSPGDNIFVADGAYSGGLTLLNNQRLIGDGSSSTLAAITGLTPPAFSTALPTFSGTDPVIASSANGINLGAGNTLRGLTVGNTSGPGLVGTSVGTLTVSESSISGSGGGIDINSGSLAVSLDGLMVNSVSQRAIRLLNVGGSFGVLSGSIANSGVQAVEIDGNPSLALNVSLTSISASNSATGILLQDTTGSFTVTGSGSTDASGGTVSTITNRGASFINATNIALSNMAFNNASTANGATCTSLDNSGCNAAIHLQNTSNVDLTNVDISTSAQQGINGLGVTDFDLVDSTITACGNEVNEGCLRMVNLAGTALIDNSNLSFPAERVAQIENSGVTLALTVRDSTFRDSQSSGLGADGLEVSSDGASNTTLDVIDSSFLRNRTNGLQVLSEGTSFVSADVTGSTFDRGAGIGIGMDLAADDTATLHFNVVGNPLINSRGSNAVNVFADGSATVQGRINGNTIQVGGVGTSGLGIKVQANTNANVKVEIDGNTISNIGWDAGIQVISRLGGTGRLDATINDNNVTVDASSLYDIWVQAQDSNTTCANVTNNTASGVAIVALRARTVDAASTVILQGAGASAIAVWDGNGNTPTGSVSSSHNGTLTLGGICNTVTHPTASANPGRFQVQEPANPTLAEMAGGALTVLRGWAESLTANPERIDLVAFGAQVKTTALRLGDGLVKALGATPAYASGETVNVGLGDLNPGQEVIIVFDVTVDGGFPPSVTEVCNQGLFTAANFADLLTDDPALGGVTDPTCTPVFESNTAPVADDDSYSTNEDTALNVAAPGVLAGDTDAENHPLTAVLDSDVGDGTLLLNSDGSFDYTPDPGFCGPDSFTYHANDGLADSNVATVSIDVVCNAAPLAVDRISSQFARTRQGIQLKSFVFVEDGGGAPVAGVEVTATLDVPGVGTGIVKTAMTNANGRATFKVLSTKPRGTWQLCVTGVNAPGYIFVAGPGDCQTWPY